MRTTRSTAARPGAQDLHRTVVERYRHELDATRDEYERVVDGSCPDRGRLVAARARLAATVSRYDGMLRSADAPRRHAGDRRPDESTDVR